MLLDCFDLFAQGFGFLKLFFLAILLKKRCVAEPTYLILLLAYLPFCNVHLSGSQTTPFQFPAGLGV